MPKIQPYSLEFRQEAVRLLRTSGPSIPQLASGLGVSPQSLRNWRRQLAVGDIPPIEHEQRYHDEARQQPLPGTPSAH